MSQSLESLSTPPGVGQGSAAELTLTLRFRVTGSDSKRHTTVSRPGMSVCPSIQSPSHDVLSTRVSETEHTAILFEIEP
jgi:hypothetical protein